jgi:hypothetical protein
VTRTGFDEPRDDDDCEPEPLPEWVDAGFSEHDASVWMNWRFRIREARAWQHAGVDGGLPAAQWATAGATPATVGQWLSAGIKATEAVMWHEFGFSAAESAHHRRAGRAPHEAYTRSQGGGRLGAITTRSFGPQPHGDVHRFAEAGVPGHIMFSYQNRQWLDDTALAWAKEGIDAAEAILWKELGLTAPEAGRLARKNRTVSEVVRDWWKAGIPYDELADWIGAGLDPDEAADQRRKGITAEQAAALRALRDQDADT